MAKGPKRPGGNPPKEHQFKPGQSGNPGGRPKRPPSLRETAAARLEQQVWLNVGGQRTRVPLRQAIIDKILAGLDTDEFFKMANWLEGPAPPRSADESEAEAANDDDAAIVAAAVERAIARRTAGVDGDE